MVPGLWASPFLFSQNGSQQNCFQQDKREGLQLSRSVTKSSLLSAVMVMVQGESTLAVGRVVGTGWPNLNACPVWRAPRGLANSILVISLWSKGVKDQPAASHLAQIVPWQWTGTLNFSLLEIEGFLWPLSQLWNSPSPLLIVIHHFSFRQHDTFEFKLIPSYL